MDKFVQRQPKNAKVDDSITNSSSISVAIELLPEVSSGPIDIVCPPTKPQKRHSYQNHWGKKYSWLLYVKEKYNLFCRYCKWFSESGKKFTSKFAKTTFTSEGFSNWKKALDKL